jgi:molybdate transport system substrate-binding protein
VGSAWAQTVRVVAAADLQYALPNLARAFASKNPGTKVQLTFGSSGKLFTQLTQGLEADIYFSAEAIYPKLLEERGLT